MIAINLSVSFVHKTIQHVNSLSQEVLVRYPECTLHSGYQEFFIEIILIVQ